MSNTIWVLKEGQNEDNWDHSFILKQEESLNCIADKLEIKRLSDFYDYSILNEEFDVTDTKPNYIQPYEIKKSLELIIKEIKDGNTGLVSSEDLLEELEDCLYKVTEAEKENCNIRFSIVP